MKKVLPLVAILTITIIGIHTLLGSHAQSPYTTIVASSGQLSGLASAQASNSSNYVQFGYTPTTSLAVHVDGNQLIDGQGKAIRLLGVAVSGTEDACIQNKGFSWGALNSAEVQAMTTWKVNIARVPLNEDCWLGINGAPAAYSGATYQNVIKNWVAELNNAGITVILDLHWAAPGTYQATQQWPMADEDHTPTFWTQVATTFKSSPAIIFDPFNEPFIGKGAPTTSDWACWLNGCSTTFTGTINGVANSTVNYATAGMQQLVNSIRSTGASQPIMIGGLNWAGDPCGLKNYDGNNGPCTETKNMPTDPDNQLAISFHTYSWTACITTTCWDAVAQGAKTTNLPIITGELGENDCTDNYINNYMNWADQNNVSYLAWSWEINWRTSCTTGQSGGGSNLELLQDWSGTPSPISPEASDYRAHLLLKNP